MEIIDHFVRKVTWQQGDSNPGPSACICVQGFKSAQSASYFSPSIPAVFMALWSMRWCEHQKIPSSSPVAYKHHFSTWKNLSHFCRRTVSSPGLVNNSALTGGLGQYPWPARKNVSETTNSTPRSARSAIISVL